MPMQAIHGVRRPTPQERDTEPFSAVKETHQNIKMAEDITDYFVIIQRRMPQKPLRKIHLKHTHLTERVTGSYRTQNGNLANNRRLWGVFVSQRVSVILIS